MGSGASSIRKAQGPSDSAIENTAPRDVSSIIGAGIPVDRDISHTAVVESSPAPLVKVNTSPPRDRSPRNIDAHVASDTRDYDNINMGVRDYDIDRDLATMDEEEMMEYVEALGRAHQKRIRLSRANGGDDDDDDDNNDYDHENDFGLFDRDILQPCGGDDDDDDDGEVDPEVEAAAAMFASTSMSLDMDNDDLLFNLLYFGGNEQSAQSIGHTLSNALQETVAAHSANNTPYKLKPASKGAVDGLEALTVKLNHTHLEGWKGKVSSSSSNAPNPNPSPNPNPNPGPTNVQLNSCEFLHFDDWSTSELECAVCKDRMEVEESVIPLPKCRHVFHETCLMRWVTLQDWCPVCRSPVADSVGMRKQLSVKEFALNDENTKEGVKFEKAPLTEIERELRSMSGMSGTPRKSSFRERRASGDVNNGIGDLLGRDYASRSTDGEDRDHENLQTAEKSDGPEYSV